MEEVDRAVLETWLGPIESGDEFGFDEDLGRRLERLTSPDLVALEVLLARQAQFIALASQVASDDVRSNHTENMKRIGPLISGLVHTIETDPDIDTSSGDAEKLVRRAKGEADNATQILTTTVDNSRRG